MVLVFVHGWSVRDTSTYGELPQRLRRELARRGRPIEVEHVYLGKYVSFDDDVTLEDIARAFDFALREKLYDSTTGAWKRFACITHSTGGPVVRLWMDLFYGPGRQADCPLTHCIALAPPHHGSALAQLGKGRLSRMKFALEGVEAGREVLNWLELGSSGGWDLDLRWLDYDPSPAGPWFFSLIGQTIDRHLYDHLNSYTGEPGSDGVVRVASANLNYQYLRLEQRSGALAVSARRRSRAAAFGVMPGVAHSGKDIGILTGVTENGDHPVAGWVIRCLNVQTPEEYEDIAGDLASVTAEVQQHERLELIPRLCGRIEHENPRHAMVTFRVRDNRGTPLHDYDLLLTAGPAYSPDELPRGFCRDRQRNRLDPSSLTYYLDYDLLSTIDDSPLDGRLGFRLQARPWKGLAYYEVAEFRSAPGEVTQLLRSNETLLVEIVLHRNVDARVFNIEEAPDRTGKVVSFSSAQTGRKAA